ncbi:hypothetical protein OOZ19_26775 [Saccharopolyspora sp. NFXS83]|uniref:hypothetical protein n=1 Tax=Saccharopolyspora sp. NFXS83 TaxID=2993560 RepID=UPI00224AF79D|nr:hypothetical protein [Saccharopolyspora sp. NFXS83]MCX2733865.1 hypothetical protein [Saccharopolyspora sp. NFXS83]
MITQSERRITRFRQPKVDLFRCNDPARGKHNDGSGPHREDADEIRRWSGASRRENMKTFPRSERNHLILRDPGERLENIHHHSA